MIKNQIKRVVFGVSLVGLREILVGSSAVVLCFDFFWFDVWVLVFGFGGSWWRKDRGEKGVWWFYWVGRENVMWEWEV